MTPRSEPWLAALEHEARQARPGLSDTEFRDRMRVRASVERSAGEPELAQVYELLVAYVESSDLVEAAA